MNVDERRLRRALERLAAEAVGPAMGTDEVSRRSRRRIARNGLVAALGVCTLAVMGVVVAGQLPERQPPAVAPSPTPTDVDEVRSAEAIVERWGGALAWRDGHDGPILLTSAEGTRELPFGSGGLIAPQGQERGIFGSEGMREGVATLPRVWRPDGDAVELSALAPYRRLTDADWAPDGRRIAMNGLRPGGGGWWVLVVSVTDGAVTDLVPSNGQGVSWSPDGASLAYISADRALTVLDLESMTERELLAKGELEDLFWPLWSPSGQYIAAVAERPNGDRVPLVVSADSGEIVGTGMPNPTGPPYRAWRAGTDELIYTQGAAQGPLVPGITPSVWVMSAPTWSSELVLELPGQHPRSVFSSPDGRAALVSSEGPEAPPHRWTVVEFDTGDREQWDQWGWIFDWR